MKFLKVFFLCSIISAALVFSSRPVLAAAGDCGAGSCPANYTCQATSNPIFCCPVATPTLTACGTSCCEVANCYHPAIGLPTCVNTNTSNLSTCGSNLCVTQICCDTGTLDNCVPLPAAGCSQRQRVNDGCDSDGVTCHLKPTDASVPARFITAAGSECGNHLCDPGEACEFSIVAGGVPFTCDGNGGTSPLPAGQTCNATCTQIISNGQGGAISGNPSTYHLDTTAIGVTPKFTTLGGITSFVVKTMVGLAGVAFMIMFLIGAFKFVTSQGDKAAVESAKGTITSAFIGVALTAALFAIMTLLQNVFGVSLLNITT
ncbi:MAG: pilin [candidate division WWE3 bacterium]|nr:pilin [candidate division WWE3 bacterium]